MDSVGLSICIVNKSHSNSLNSHTQELRPGAQALSRSLPFHKAPRNSASGSGQIILEKHRLRRTLKILLVTGFCGSSPPSPYCGPW